MKRALWIIAILAALAVAAGVGVVKFKAAVNAPPPPTTVRVDRVVRGDLVETVSAPGQVVPKTKVSISAKISARITELPYLEGSVVTKGSATRPASVLVKLDSKDLEAQLRASNARKDAQGAQIRVAQSRVVAQEAQIDSSRVLLADAQRELRRQVELLASHDVSQQAVDQAQAKVDQLKAQLAASLAGLEADKSNLVVMRHELEAADAEIARAADNLSYTTITSPIDGVVTRVNAQVGELVVTGTMNNAGTVIIEVADLSQMIVNARVDETTVAHVHEGQAVKVSIQAYPETSFDGVVQSVALANTEEKDGSKYYKTEILIKSPGRQILSGLTADVDIETQRHANVIKVPGQCVLERSIDDLPPAVRDRPEVDRKKAYATVVYRLIDGKAVVTPVTIGPSDLTHTIIVSGLAESDRVIAGPYKALEALANDQAVKEEAASTRPSTTTAATPG